MVLTSKIGLLKDTTNFSNIGAITLTQSFPFKTSNDPLLSSASNGVNLVVSPEFPKSPGVFAQPFKRDEIVFKKRCNSSCSPQIAMSSFPNIEIETKEKG